MTPRYLFTILGRSTNLLCPFDVTTLPLGYKSELIPLEYGGYKVLVDDGSTPTVLARLYNASKTFIQDVAITIGEWYPFTTLYSGARYVELSFSNATTPEHVFFGQEETFDSWFNNVFNPLWKDDMTMEFAKESQQEFFRRKLSGKLTFINDDYTYIKSKSLDYQFQMRMMISYDNGENWADYWKGHFYWTDCDINDDDRTCVVTPEVEDEYVKVLAGYENTMDMIQLAPAMKRISYWKRPVFQFYIAGANTIGCFQMGVYWEQEATPTSSYSTLHDTYKFGALRHYRMVIITGSNLPELNGVYVGYDDNAHDGSYPLDFEVYGTNPDGTLTGYKCGVYTREIPGGGQVVRSELLSNDESVLYYTGGRSQTELFLNTPEPDSGATDPAHGDISYYTVYGRIVNDVGPDVDPQNYELPDDDITDTSGYKYGEPMGVSGGGGTGWEGFIYLIHRFQNEPTQYGQYYNDDGLVGYYNTPEYQEAKYYQPVSRNSWNEISVWLDNTKWSMINLANNFRCKQIVLKDAYSLASVIQKAVKSLDSSLDFQLTADYSDLMTNRLGQILYITPKSNILKSEYDKPAMKAPFTFKNLMDAMKSMFQAYWFIDNGKFRIERIDFFMNGGSYTTPANVGRDLTEETVSRNGKAWAFCTNKYQFDKADLPERMEFRWMDECSTIFQGNALVMESAFVSKGSKEEINVPEITSDINMMLISRDRFSSDGFALLSCDNNNEVINWERSTGFYIQNGLLSFDYLQEEYYQYNMPCYSVEVENEDRSINVQSVRKTKRSEANFPCPNDPDILKLIKTLVGNGQFEKLSINLSSRNGKATLKYNPYE